MNTMKYGVVAVLLLFAAVCSGAEEEQENKNEVEEARRIMESAGNFTALEVLRDATCWLVGQCPADDFEGRKKKHKKYLIYGIGAALLAKATFLPILLGFLKLLTGKALLITKMALMLITIITLKRSGHSPHPQVINLLPKKHHEVYPEVHSEYKIKG